MRALGDAVAAVVAPDALLAIGALPAVLGGLARRAARAERELDPFGFREREVVAVRAQAGTAGTAAFAEVVVVAGLWGGLRESDASSGRATDVESVLERREVTEAAAGLGLQQ